MFGNLNPSELLFFGVIALMLFGARLPDVARNLGGTYRELRKHLNDFQREFQMGERYDPPKKPNISSDDSTPQQSSAPKFKPPPSEEE